MRLPWGSGFLTPRSDMGRKSKFSQDIADLLIIIALVQRDPLRVLFCWLRAFHHKAFKGLTHHFHIVPIGALNGQPHGDAMPFSQQAALDATFGPVSGVGARIVTSQGCFGHGAVHTQPGPIKTLELIELGYPRFPQLQKRSCFDPFLITVMGSRVGTQFGLVQRLPLTARSQHIEDRVCTLSVWDTRASTAKPVRVEMNRQARLLVGPQIIGNPIAGGRFVIRTSGTSSFRFACECFHTQAYRESFKGAPKGVIRIGP
jgi:hypothetical protein